MRPRNAAIATGAAVAALIVALEAAWLLPPLDQRVDVIIAGQQAPASQLHKVHIAFEIGKLLLLGILAFIMARRLARQ